MPTSNLCEKCGATLSADAPRGLCPRCLLEAALEDTAKDQPAEPGADGSARPARSFVAPEVGRTLRYFGDYELLEKIAQGGMGVVYRARQVTLNRTVAVKMILGGRLASAADVQRFLTEAEAAASLQHPNIVAIHEVGQEAGQYYFSMDYVAGKNLAVYAREKALPAGQAAQLVKTIAEAIQYAHQRGILHRDLKPQNVLLDANGQPHITDFGLAKQIESDSGLTRSGAVLGSPSYMPPEQASGRHHEVGPASDVYSLGAVLYQLLTGKPPFAGGTPHDIIRHVIETEPVPLRKLNPKTPPDLETICLKCLEKRPERRYHSALELAEELHRFLNYEPILARPAGVLRKTWSWAQQQPWLFAALFGALVLILTCVAYGLWENSRVLSRQLEATSERLERARFVALRSGFEAVTDPLEKSALLERRLTLAKNPPAAQAQSPAVFFFLLFPGLCLLVYFVGKAFRRVYRRRLEGPVAVRPIQIVFHGATGLSAIVAGLSYWLVQIRAWAWHSSPALIFALELAAVLCALVLMGMGFRMVWEALGMHETSRFRSVVDKTLERQLAEEARLWSVWKLVGFAFWLLLVAGGVGFQLFGFLPSEAKWDILLGRAGLLLGTGLLVLVTYAVRRRFRLLPFVFAPLVATLFLAGTVAVALGPKPGMILLLSSLLVLVLIPPGVFVFGSKSRPTERRRFPVDPSLDALYAAGLFILILVLFHVEESWRGRRAWAQVKADLIAKGESLDLAAFLNPAVPQEENVMAHPYMKRYFLKGTPAWSVPNPLLRWRVGPGPPYAVDDLRKLPRQPEPTLSCSSLVAGQARADIIPTLEFTNRPLVEVFSELSQRAGLSVRPSIDPWADWANRKRGKTITRTFTNTTAVAALDDLANEYGLSADPIEWQTNHRLFFTITKPSLQGVRDWYRSSDDEFRQLEEALARPHSQLRADPRNLLEMPSPNFVSFRSAAQTYTTLSSVNLLMGDRDGAFKNLYWLRRLMDTVSANDPPLLVGTMIKVSIGGMLANALERQLAQELWPSSYMAAIQKLCEGADFLPEISRAVRGGEQAVWLRLAQATLEGGNEPDLLDALADVKHGHSPRRKRTGPGRSIQRMMLPRWWIDQNRANYARLMQMQLSGLDATARLLDVHVLNDRHKQLEQLDANSSSAYYMFANAAVPWVHKALIKLAQNQTWMDEAYLACGLERYRTARGNYPEQLDSLVPEFAARVPHDLFDGRPLRYRRTDNGQYLLYSIGWNSKDDQGELATPKNGAEWQADRGDWVWQGLPKVDRR